MMSTQSVLTLVAFLIFFLVVVPAFLYWLSRFSWDFGQKRVSFIGFPQDSRADGAPAEPSERVEARRDTTNAR